MNLRFEDILRCYGERTVLDLGHGQIDDGKITGIIGPNGAGKSTFLNIIAGLDKPSSGRITYGYISTDGHQLFSEDVPRSKMTLLFQQPYLLHTTVEKNIAYPLKLRKWPKEAIAKRTRELMEDTGLTPLAKQRGWRLSSDEMQKAAFARALSFRPELFLMDEPPSNIDSATTAEIEVLLKKANATDGMTVVLVSHDLTQIKRLCDQVIFLHHGRIIESGPVQALLASPQQPETQAFIEGRLLF
ncbi:MAG: ATP-binding cassette domain-containing protein [Coriobacteriales bacterium]|nr:ATP-binding cassette domain-containing protein [Coriobacteriales bacterium]